MAQRTWMCIGDVRGSCGIEHPTIDACETHCSEDGTGCASQGGYSDRAPVASDGSTCGLSCEHDACYQAAQ